MVSLLRFAYDYDCESSLGNELLAKDVLPELKVLQKRFITNTSPPSIPTRQHDIEHYDQLLGGAWCQSETCHV